MSVQDRLNALEWPTGPTGYILREEPKDMPSFRSINRELHKRGIKMSLTWTKADAIEYLNKSFEGETIKFDDEDFKQDIQKNNFFQKELIDIISKGVNQDKEDQVNQSVLEDSQHD